MPTSEISTAPPPLALRPDIRPLIDNPLAHSTLTLQTNLPPTFVPKRSKPFIAAAQTPPKQTHR